MTAADPLLQVSCFSVDFRVQQRWLTAVQEVSFNILPGEVLGVVGESGCGKSVTALGVLRLLPAAAARTRGETLFRGIDLQKMPEKELRKIRGAQISMVFQDPLSSLNPVLTVGDQVSEAVRIHQGLSAKLSWNRAIEMLEKVGLKDAALRARAYPHELSGGQRQRVMIAMAFICRPALVIADEPTTALDVTVQRQVLELMLELRREQGAAVMLITHDLGVVAEVADRVQVMYAGRLVETASVRDLFGSPMHPYTRGLLESVPRLQGERLARLKGIAGQPPDLTAMPEGCPYRPRCPLAHESCLVMPGWSEHGAEHAARCWATACDSPQPAGASSACARS